MLYAIGATSKYKSFIAFVVFMLAETKDNYQHALKSIKKYIWTIAT